MVYSTDHFFIGGLLCMLLKRCFRLRFVAVFLSVVVFISCTLPCFVKRTYAFVGVDDAVVAAALAAAAGITFVVSDDATRQALDDFVQQYNYTDLMQAIGNTKVQGVDLKYYYPIAAVYAEKVKSFVSDLYNHFCGVGESGSVPVSYQTVGGYTFNTSYLPVSSYVANTVVTSSSTFLVCKYADGSYLTSAYALTSDSKLLYYYYSSSASSWVYQSTIALSSVDFSKPYGFYTGGNAIDTTLYFSYYKFNADSPSVVSTAGSFVLASSTTTSIRSFNGSTYAYGPHIDDTLSGFDPSIFSSFPLPLILDSSPVTVTKNVDYKNTVPKGMTADDVANNLSEKVAAGNCAINAGTDNAIDSTQTYTQAQENLLTTTDTETAVTDTNTGLTSIIDWLRSIFNKIVALPTAISNAILALLKYLFVPAEGYFNDLFMPLRNKFNFVNDIIGASVIFKNFFNNTDFSQPPKLTVDFGKANSKYKYGGQTAILDASFYTPYKSYVDVFLSSLFWVLFLWSIFRSLSSIIKGEEARKYEKENSDNKG